jgi:hypothetical protein
MITNFVVASSGESEHNEEFFAKERASMLSRHKCSFNNLMSKENFYNTCVSFKFFTWMSLMRERRHRCFYDSGRR